MKSESKNVQMLAPEIVERLKRALEEDIGAGDFTTNSIVLPGVTFHGQIVAKQNGIVAGLDVAENIFLLLDQRVQIQAQVSEGAPVETGAILADLSGPGRALLTGERTALNFLGRMSGIATLTRRFVDAVAGTRAVILDTRKTAPGLRFIDKLAVRRGGGQNHRAGLYDMVLIKDNHIDHAGSLAEAVRRVCSGGTDLETEVEARSLNDVSIALELGLGRILLDNMTIDQIREAVSINAGRARLEVSGNVNLENVRAIAETGIDFISVGALTHSAKVFDVSLKLRKP